MPAFKAIVKGRVQGVAFRWFVVGEARALGLRGQVRNLVYREVEVVAEGERKALDVLIAALREGPPMSRVKDVDVTWLDDDDRFTEFKIVY